MFLEYEPGTYISRVSPTPLLMVVAAGDVLTVSDLAIGAYEEAREPKKLVILQGDQSVMLGEAVHVMDLAKRAGAQAISIAAQKELSPTGP